MDLHFAWQAWHLATCIFTLRGTWWHRRSLCVAAALCVADVGLGDIDCLFAWQAWRLATWTFTLRGRRGTWRHVSSPHTHLVLTQLTTCSHTTCPHTTCSHTQLVHTRPLTALGRLWWRTGFPNERGRRGPWWRRRSLCVAGVALTALGRLWWRTGFPNDAVDAAALCVAGVALGDIDCRFAWQAWHLATWTFTLRGRCGTWWHRRSLCVAGVALTALGRLWWRTGFPNDAVDAAALCVAGVALGDIDCHFAWQAWHLATWTFTLRGRRGTRRHGSFLQRWYYFIAKEVFQNLLCQVTTNAMRLNLAVFSHGFFRRTPNKQTVVVFVFCCPEWSLKQQTFQTVIALRSSKTLNCFFWVHFISISPFCTLIKFMSLHASSKGWVGGCSLICWTRERGYLDDFHARRFVSCHEWSVNWVHQFLRQRAWSKETATTDALGTSTFGHRFDMQTACRHQQTGLGGFSWEQFWSSFVESWPSQVGQVQCSPSPLWGILGWSREQEA